MQRSMSMLLLLLARGCAALCWSLRDLSFKAGTPSERPLLLSRLLRERMNTLAVDPRRFVLAYDGTNKEVAGFGQIRPLGDGACELASLVVEDRYRNLGIGTVLVTKLLARHRSSEDASKPVYLITLDTTVKFYDRLGFEVESDAPPPMRLEMAAGAIVARLATGRELVCMSMAAEDPAAVEGEE